MNPPRKTYSVQIAGLTREFPLFQVAPKLSIAVFNMLGDTEGEAVIDAFVAPG